MKILKKTLAGLIILSILIVGAVFFYLNSTKPDYSGEIKLPGLKDKVEVYFDDYGIPHIYAQNKEDLYYAFGYVHAQERLFQMEMLKRIGSGRLSEILGKDFVKTDKMFRTIGIKETAQESEKTYMSDTTTDYYKNVTAYLKGINEFVKNGKTPIEFTIIGIPKEEFKSVDLFMTAGYMAFSFAVGFKQDPLLTKLKNTLGEKYLVDLALDYVPGTKRIPNFKMPENDFDKISNISKETSQIMENLPFPNFYGSNSWVVSGAKTKSGKVIFANDTHIGFSQPAVWYEAHLECPGFNLYGNFLAGIPFALVGHSREMAWGLTMFENDDVDFFYEEINSKNQFKDKETWKNLTIINETIKVKDSANVNFQIRKTGIGPVVNDIYDIGEKPVTLNWTYTKKPSKLLIAFWQLNNSKSIDESREAASFISAPGLNVMYGDAKGNIAWWASADITKYKEGVETHLITESDSVYDLFDGYYERSENPSSENPPNGIVYSANNQPDFMNNVLYPGYYAPEARAKRINYLMNIDKDWTVDKMKKVSTDVVSMSATQFTKLILSQIDNQVVNKSAMNKAAFTKLADWDGSHYSEMSEPVIYYRFMRKILELTLNDEVKNEEDFELLISGHFIQNTLQKLLTNENSIWWDNIDTKNKKETRKEIFSKAFENAITALNSELGNDIKTWKWEKVHTVEHGHLLGNKKPLDKLFNVGPFGVFGGTETLNNLNFHLSKDGNYKVYNGPAMRIIIDFSDVENSVSVLPTGQSGNFMSKHYNDQAEMYNSGTFRKQMMNKQEIISVSKNKIVFL
jgi:penicillin amidase